MLEYPPSTHMQCHFLSKELCLACPCYSVRIGAETLGGAEPVLRGIAAGQRAPPLPTSNSVIRCKKHTQ